MFQIVRKKRTILKDIGKMAQQVNDRLNDIDQEKWPHKSLKLRLVFVANSSFVDENFEVIPLKIKKSGM